MQKAFSFFFPYAMQKKHWVAGGENPMCQREGQKKKQIYSLPIRRRDEPMKMKKMTVTPIDKKQKKQQAKRK